MEETNDILTAVREGFARVDQQFARVDQQFSRVDEQFLTLRREFADQLDGVSNGLHLELRAHKKALLERVEAVRVGIEKLDSKIGLMGENVANVMEEISRYHSAVEAPFETRVIKLEGRMWALEQKK
jgi:hypothetical protein